MLTNQDFSACYVDGQWVSADSGALFSVLDPASGDNLANIPDCSSSEAEAAIQAAHKAFQSWKKVPAKERSQALSRWHALILEHQEALAKLMTKECGKPLGESRGEVLYAASFVEWFSEEAKRTRGDIIPAPSGDRKMLAQKQPIGVCTAITPWNFPLAMITRKCAPAIAAGCTVVVKPAEETPLSALALAKLAELAGLPAGVFNVITAQHGAEVGLVLSTHPLVRKISFTGSTAVGKILLKQAADTVKRSSMELGGNAPFIVFEDADIQKAVQGAMASKYRNTGQTCVCANRFLVQESIAEEFANAMAEASSALKVGNGLDAQVDQGPLITEEAVNKVETLVKEALGAGAELKLGGKRHALGGQFYEPTVLANVSPEMRIAQEEIFGPVTAITTFKTEEDALSMANNTPYGLAAYFYTENTARIFRVADGLEYGMVGVNEGILSSEMAPFGGMKESGLGREGSHLGISEYLETQYVCIGGLG